MTSSNQGSVNGWWLRAVTTLVRALGVMRCDHVSDAYRLICQI